MAALADPKAALSPTSESERIEVLDVLRGFALFGILLVNINVTNTIDNHVFFISSSSPYTNMIYRPQKHGNLFRCHFYNNIPKK